MDDQEPPQNSSNDDKIDEFQPVEKLNNAPFYDVSALEENKSEFTDSSNIGIAEFLMTDAGTSLR